MSERNGSMQKFLLICAIVGILFTCVNYVISGTERSTTATEDIKNIKADIRNLKETDEKHAELLRLTREDLAGINQKTSMILDLIKKGSH
jgi:uncharacterized membrane protein (DUF106 family)